MYDWIAADKLYSYSALYAGEITVMSMLRVQVYQHCVGQRRRNANLALKIQGYEILQRGLT